MIDLKRKETFGLLMKSVPMFTPDLELNPTFDKRDTTAEHGVDKDEVILKDDHPDTVAEAFEKWSREVCGVMHRYNQIDGWSLYSNDKYQLNS